MDDAQVIEQLREWAEASETGDREEVTSLSEDHPIWEKVSSDADFCFGSSCDHFRDCFVTRLKVKAQASEIIVVNHHLFFADLAIRKLGFGEVIPRYKAVIFDEAHALEDVITEYFGISLSDRRIGDLARDLRNESSWLGRAQAKELERITARVENLVDTAFSGIRKNIENFSREDEGKRIPFLISHIPAPLVQSGFELSRELSNIAAMFHDKADSAELMGFSSRASKLAGDLNFLLRQDEPGFVYYSDLRPRSLILRASPLEVKDLLKESFYPSLESIIFTSATLTVADKKEPSFEYFKSRMGLDQADSASQLWLKSSFELEETVAPAVAQGDAAPGQSGLCRGRLENN